MPSAISTALTRALRSGAPSILAISARIPPSPSLSARMMKSDELDRDDQRDRPEDQRDHPEDVAFGRLHRLVVGGEDGLQRVERAGADVAEDDAERAERERRHAELAAGGPGGRVRGGGHTR